MKSTKTLTAVDKDALRRLPEGWFELNQVSYIVRNPRYRCDRLVDRGVLERKCIPYTIGENLGIGYQTWWRKIEPNDLCAHATPLKK
jgi:hypothetical protein